MVIVSRLQQMTPVMNNSCRKMKARSEMITLAGYGDLSSYPLFHPRAVWNFMGHVVVDWQLEHALPPLGRK